MASSSTRSVFLPQACTDHEAGVRWNVALGSAQVYLGMLDAGRRSMGRLLRLPRRLDRSSRVASDRARSPAQLTAQRRRTRPRPIHARRTKSAIVVRARELARQREKTRNASTNSRNGTARCLHSTRANRSTDPSLGKESASRGQELAPHIHDALIRLVVELLEESEASHVGVGRWWTFRRLANRAYRYPSEIGSRTGRRSSSAVAHDCRSKPTATG